jgi:hypothetical protein
MLGLDVAPRTLPAGVGVAGLAVGATLPVGDAEGEVTGGAAGGLPTTVALEVTGVVSVLSAVAVLTVVPWAATRL